MLLLLAHLALAAPITATTAPAFSWTAFRDAKTPTTVATFAQGTVTYGLTCDQATCRITHGTTALAAHLTLTVVKGTEPVVGVVIDGTDAGYLFSKVAVRWAAPALPKGMVLKLGGNELE